MDFKVSGFVRKAFELFAEGDKSFTDISEFLVKMGVTKGNGTPIKIKQVRQILANKFYIGIMKFAGEYYEGSHEQFIGKDLFQSVQGVLKKRDKHHAKSDSFPFLGVMKCSGCGASVTAEKHIKHYKRTNRKVTYSYYRCTRKQGRCVELPITSTDLEVQMRNVISDVAIPASWGKQWLEWLAKDEIEEKQNTEIKSEGLSRNVEATDRKLNILLDSYLDQVIDPDTYKLKKNELFENKFKFREEMGRLQRGESNWIEPMRNFINTAVKGEKIARAENNIDEIANFVKNLGSNFFLHSRQISAVHNNGFDMLRAPAPARNLLTCEPDHSLCVDSPGIGPGSLRCERSILPFNYEPE
ncbi:MAG: recombinase [Microgenomates group bacterium Gr01-1014_16]|nr:MAG: recombinase [Microgenomates group bacterium Gr01-1014_16]